MIRCSNRSGHSDWHLSQPQRSLLHLFASLTRRIHILGLLLSQSRETCRGMDAGDANHRREPGERARSRPSPFCLAAPPSPARSSLSHRVPTDDAASLPFPPGRGHRPRPSSFLSRKRGSRAGWRAVVMRDAASSHFCSASTPSSHSQPRVNGNQRGSAGSTRPDLEIRGDRKRTGGVRIAMDNGSSKERMFYDPEEQPILQRFSASLLGLAGRRVDSGSSATTGMGTGMLVGKRR